MQDRCLTRCFGRVLPLPPPFKVASASGEKKLRDGHSETWSPIFETFSGDFLKLHKMYYDHDSNPEENEPIDISYMNPN